VCDYSTNNKYAFQKHLTTKKHINNQKKADSSIKNNNSEEMPLEEVIKTEEFQKWVESLDSETKPKKPEQIYESEKIKATDDTVPHANFEKYANNQCKYCGKKFDKDDHQSHLLKCKEEYIRKIDEEREKARQNGEYIPHREEYKKPVTIEDYKEENHILKCTLQEFYDELVRIDINAKDHIVINIPCCEPNSELLKSIEKVVKMNCEAYKIKKIVINNYNLDKSMVTNFDFMP
jgi:hypothetical protein